jgi:thiamine-phosphate pyrophosphorylase
MTPRPQFDPTLYAIADATVLRSRDAPGLLAKAIAGGVTAVQIRAKELTDEEFRSFASELVAVTRRHKIPAIVNDRVEATLSLQADGVHLGSEDKPVPDARRLLGERAIIGVTAHSLDEVVAAGDLGIDYLGFGSIFPSPSKAVDTIQGVDGVRRARELTRLPIVAIGGITVERTAEVIEAGADGVAVISGLWGAEDPGSRAKEYIDAIARGRRRR